MSSGAVTFTPTPIAIHSSRLSRHRASMRIPPSLRLVDIEIVRPFEPDRLGRKSIESPRALAVPTRSASTSSPVVSTGRSTIVSQRPRAAGDVHFRRFFPVPPSDDSAMTRVPEPQPSTRKPVRNVERRRSRLHAARPLEGRAVSASSRAVSPSNLIRRQPRMLRNSQHQDAENHAIQRENTIAVLAYVSEKHRNREPAADPAARITPTNTCVAEVALSAALRVPLRTIAAAVIGMLMRKLKTAADCRSNLSARLR